ncbi:4-hydroxythreonine-4-phosphate dehydrogenase [Congregibacter litoralis KT71]|uniref:4-hydroxythreonine-4-phosphate dehydrogenase n=1 Tax=Congregibacter litoralis KT71 TaxID=314285 RepID=A4A6V0_9GAMM|nr:4-hydroxythreonine-4-phosphate dehydrogenase [Congregibacter litoralis KT71]
MTRPLSTSNKIPRLAISAGEPAGIGPDIVLAAAQRDWPAELVVIADQDMLAARAELLGLTVNLRPYDAAAIQTSRGHSLSIIHEPLAVPAQPALADSANAGSVLAALKRATQGCMSGEFDAMVTAPVNKAVIADSGVPFSGHTEYLAELTASDQVVMLLAAKELRVALATTHIPLSQVPESINPPLLLNVLRVMDADLKSKFGIVDPQISVLGLNPHAGEGGHLGMEDIEVIIPALKQAKSEGIQVSGPWPADTAFNPRLSPQTDAYLAMYHDQGLPVLKFASFGAAVNITLGLPIIRTSVDHGTAFDLAGTGKADPGSFFAAVESAMELIKTFAKAE